MSLNDMGAGYALTMPVQPMGYGYPMQYGGGGLGSLGGFGDGWLIILLLLLGGGMWGGFGMGGWGGMMGAGMMGMDWLYPWLNNSQNINGGFRDQNLHSSIDSLRESTSDGFRDIQLQRSIEGVRDAVNTGFSSVQLGQAGLSKELCATGRDITGAVRDGFSSAEIAANGRQMANLQQLFGIEKTILGGDAANAAGIADLKYTVARENCDDRAAMAQGFQGQTMNGVQNTNAIITELRNGFQALKDEFCADRLALERRGREEDQREIAQLRTELMFTRGQQSQTDQTAQLSRIIDAATNALYTRAQNCPLPSMPVYGNQQIFRCSGPAIGNTCGCNGMNLPQAS